MSILSDKKRYEHTYSCNTEKNNLFLQHDRRYPPKVSIKRLPIKNGGLTALNGRIPPEEHRTLLGLSLKLRSARGPTDRIPQICQRAARYLGDLTGNIAGETKKKQGRICSTYQTGQTAQSVSDFENAGSTRSTPYHSFLPVRLPCGLSDVSGTTVQDGHPIHRRTATLIYGQVDMTGEGPPLLGTSAPVNAVRRVPCFRPFSCIDIDTRNVYDYILNFVEQFQHITRQICSPIAARP